jgi:phage major head subunit gpT-like protein
MLLTSANLSLFFTAMETTYNIAKSLAPVVHPMIATTYPVTTETWANAWLTMTERLRLWSGPRYVEPLGPMVYSVPMQLFEKTAGIPRAKFEDDVHGVFSDLARQFGLQNAKWPDYELLDLIQDQGAQTGVLQNGTDGLAGFSTVHPVNYWNAALGTFPNDYTGGAVEVNGTIVGGALTQPGLTTLVQDTARRQNESGKAGGFRADKILVGSMLENTGKTLLQSSFMGAPIVGTLGTGDFPTGGSATPANSAMVGATENVLKGYCDMVVWEDLGGSATVGNTTQDYVWYALCTKKGIMPWSWLLRNEPGFIARTNPNDSNVFDTAEFLWGTDFARGAPAWSLPTLFSRSSA